MVPHADHGDRHDQKDASEAQGFLEAVFPFPVNPVSQASLGKEGGKEGDPTRDSDFRQHVEVHVMGMENEHMFILDKEIVIRISKEIGAPADAEKRMFFDHGFRRFPKGKPQAHRCVFAGEQGEEPFRNLAVIEEKDNGNQKEEKAEPFVIEKRQSQHDGSQAHPGAPGVGQGQAENEYQEKNAKGGLPLSPFPQEEGRKETDDHKKIGAKKIRIFQSGIHAAAEERESFRIHPALGRHIFCHILRIGILEKAVSRRHQGTGQEGIEGCFFFLFRFQHVENKKVQGRIHEGLESPVHEGKPGIEGYKAGKKSADKKYGSRLPEGRPPE